MDTEGIRRIADALRKDANLRPAPDARLAELARRADRRRFARGEYVFRTGDDPRHYFLVESGRVVLSRESPSGRAFTYRLAGPGTPVNTVACFRTRPHLFSARAEEDTVAVALPAPVFRDWVLSTPEVAGGIIATMSDLLDDAYTRILDLIDGSVEERIRNALSMLSSQNGPDLPLTNAGVAELVGTSRETAARVVSQLQSSGLIAKSRGIIRILDKKRLDASATSPLFKL